MPTLKTLVTFNGSNGNAPTSGLIADAAGDLFGTTTAGGKSGNGTVFEIPNTAGGYASTPTTLVSFNIENGALPSGGLIADAAGDLFGTTQNDGPQHNGLDGGGTVFELVNNGGGSYTLISFFSFAGTNGANPTSAGLIADAAGNLFGTTAAGPVQLGGGTVFEVAKTAGGYASAPTVLAGFSGDPDGSAPQAGLVADTAGDLFGTTTAGGTNNAGTVFEVAKIAGGYASTATILVSFNSKDGAVPVANLVTDAAGDLFGTTSEGGPGGAGTVFEIAKTAAGYASTPTTLVGFTGINGEGAGPHAGLIADAAGDLFGTTAGGGTSGEGTAFEVPKTPTGYGPLITLVSFGGANTTPEAGLVADAAGDLFGTTVNGGIGDGSVFEITNTGFVVCFLAGAQIATPAGETAVERLAVGDMVLTHRGEARRIVWIGKGRVLATRGQRNAATPVIVCKGALANNVPHRNLRITKGHSLYIDGVLIPVEFLVNHRSILWDDRAQEVTLYHVELETHDVLLANGAPAESYRDDGNRWLFQNANSGWDLPPQEPCAPVLMGGPIVDAVWRRLLERSGPRASLPLTDDADLHVVIDGERLDAAERAGDVCVFHLSKLPSYLNIVSRAAAPAELGLARDPRVLGVALRRVVVRKGTRFRVTEANDNRLTEGFHAFEVDNGFRWTNGDAAIPAELYDGFTAPFELVVQFAATARYLADGAAQRVA
jgi:uncharacterized repeat protein (TIGR03803 family)